MRSGLAAPCLLLLAALVAAAPARAEGPKEMAVHKITQAESYVGLNPIYTTILDNGRPAGLLLVSVGLDIPDAELRETAIRALPLLRDYYVRNLMAFTAAAVRPLRQPDVTVIADRLQGVTDRALGRKGARLLLGQVVVRITK